MILSRKNNRRVVMMMTMARYRSNLNKVVMQTIQIKIYGTNTLTTMRLTRAPSYENTLWRT